MAALSCCDFVSVSMNVRIHPSCTLTAIPFVPLVMTVIVFVNCLFIDQHDDARRLAVRDR